MVAVTRISPWFNSSTFTGQVLNYFSTILRLLFPVELFRLGAKYYVYIIAQIIISFFYLRAFRTLNCTGNRSVFAMVLFTGFLMMSAVHEIEFGSWIRHEISAVPIFVMMNERYR